MNVFVILSGGVTYLMRLLSIQTWPVDRGDLICDRRDRPCMDGEFLWSVPGFCSTMVLLVGKLLVT